MFAAFCSDKELERGDREVWGSVGDNQIGIMHQAAMPVKYGYDTVLDNAANNEQVSIAAAVFTMVPIGSDLLHFTACMLWHIRSVCSRAFCACISRQALLLKTNEDIMQRMCCFTQWCY